MLNKYILADDKLQGLKSVVLASDVEDRLVFVISHFEVLAAAMELLL